MKTKENELKWCSEHGSKPNKNCDVCKAAAQPDSAALLREIHTHIVSRSEWWRTNPDDSHGINTAVYVAMIEVANAINSTLVLKEIDKKLFTK